jgi:hypothetical protein
MKIEVNKNYVKFDVNTKVNKREFKATPLEFEFSEDYDDLTCKAVFSVIPKNKEEEITFYQQPIINNKCFIPYEVMDGEGVLIGVYGYSVDGEELILRYSPEPKNLWFLEGSYYEGAETPEEILPSQFEQYTAYLNSQIERLNRINIETEELPDGVKISVTNADGVTTETEVYNGEKGEPGERGEPGLPGTTDYEDLTNKPSINGTTLEGDVSLEDIGIGSVFTIKGSVATPENLPSTGNSIGDVYYVESVMAGYVWIEIDNVEQWEELGEPIDLSSYYTKTETDDLLDDKQDTLTAGTGIDITNNVISATGGEDTFYFDGSSNPNTEEKKALWQKIYDRWHIEGKGSNLYIFVGNNKWVLCDLTFVGNYSISYTPVPSNTNTQYFYAMSVSGSVSFTNGVVSNINPYFLANYKRVKIPQEYNTSAPEYNMFYVLGTNNTKAYTPTADYHPSTKKYVDDSISSAIGSINTILATLTTPSNGGGN